MVARDSQISVASEGSKTYDSPRKRHEHRRSQATSALKISHHKSISENRDDPGLFSRAPPPPRYKTDHWLEPNDDVQRKDGVPLQMQRSRSSPNNSQRQRSRTNSLSRRPPISPSMQKAVAASNPLRMPRTLSRTRSNRSSTRSQCSRSSASSTRKKKSSSSRTQFHVRVSLGYLTGIKAELLPKKKKNQQNLLVVGYATLAKTGKQMALSQPIGPNIADPESKSIKMIWSTPKENSNIAPSGKQRKLLFSLRLEKESELLSKSDDDSFAVQPGFHPEVVKILIGLKCGDEKFPLGIANLVISGNEVLGQQVDMALRPITEQPYVERQRQQRGRIGIFGSGKKQQGVSFSNNDQLYRLASNATLSVKVDIKQSIPGEAKNMIWGEGDDDTQISCESYDTRKTGHSYARALITQGSHLQSISSSFGNTHPSQRLFEEERELPPPMNLRENNSMVRSHGSGLSNSQLQASRRKVVDGEEVRKVSGEKVPLKYIVVRPDETSVVSGLSIPGQNLFLSFFMKDCLPICGDDLSRKQSPRVTGNMSFLEEVPRRDESEGKREVSNPTCDDPFINEEYGIRSDQRHIQHHRTDSKHHLKTPAGGKVAGGKSEGDTVDIEVETYADLKNAQETLLRYANKVGVTMEDLLASDEGSKKGKKERRDKNPMILSSNNNF